MNESDWSLVKYIVVLTSRQFGYLQQGCHSTHSSSTKCGGGNLSNRPVSMSSVLNENSGGLLCDSNLASKSPKKVNAHIPHQISSSFLTDSTLHIAQLWSHGRINHRLFPGGGIIAFLARLGTATTLRKDFVAFQFSKSA